MRRKRIRAFQPVIRRSGVIASVMQRNRSVQMPVSLVRSLRGFALRFPVSAAQTSQASGPSEARKTKGFNADGGWRMADLNDVDFNDADLDNRPTSQYGIGLAKTSIRNPRSAVSVVPPQIHAGVHRRDLIAVTIEHQRFATQELTNAPFGCLAPARVIDRR